MNAPPVKRDSKNVETMEVNDEKERDTGKIPDAEYRLGGLHQRDYRGSDVRVDSVDLEQVNGEGVDVKTEHSAEVQKAHLAEHSAETSKEAVTEHSAEAPKAVRAEHSARPLRLVPEKSRLKTVSRQASKRQSVESKNNVVQLNTQRGMVFDESQWKRSRKKAGYLIRRMKGYSIAETEYGVSYLWVLSRKPDRTTADNSAHPLAGYFNWKALEGSGLIAKERKSDRRDKTAIG